MTYPPVWILLITYERTDIAVETIKGIKDICASYPKEVIARRVTWYFGRFRALSFALNKSDRRTPITAVMMVGQAIGCLCKICFLAEGKPFPYEKWLIRGIKITELGKRLSPLIEKAALNINDFLQPPEDKDYPDLEPVKALLECQKEIRRGLKELGWDPDWVDCMVRRSMGVAQEGPP